MRGRVHVANSIFGALIGISMSFIQAFEVMFPIVIIIALGYAVGKSKLAIDAQSLGSLVILLCTPSLVFSKLTTATIETSVLLEVSLAAAASILLAMVLGTIALHLLNLSLRTFLPCVMFPNCGNTGLPIMILAFGDAGAALGVAFFFVVALLQFTVGISISSGQYHPKDLLKQPILYSVGFVLFFTQTGIEVPTVVAKTTDILGGMMVPAMLLLLGSSLATLKVSDLKPAIAVAASRLIIGLVSGATIIFAFDLSGLSAITVFMMSAMPVTVVSYVFAVKYRPDPQQVAGGVVLSTVLAFITLPLLFGGALAIFS